MHRALGLMALLLWTHPASGYPAEVVAVASGDTVTVLKGGQRVVVRVAQVDSPDLTQPFGPEALRLTTDLVLGQTLEVQEVPTDDPYQRVVANLTLKDGRDLAKVLVEGGIAWHYDRYSDSTELARLQIQARMTRVGLWAAADPVAPWDWRRQHRSGRPATSAPSACDAAQLVLAANDKTPVLHLHQFLGQSRAEVEALVGGRPSPDAQGWVKMGPAWCLRFADGQAVELTARLSQTAMDTLLEEAGEEVGVERNATGLVWPSLMHPFLKGRSVRRTVYAEARVVSVLLTR